MKIKNCLYCGCPDTEIDTCFGFRQEATAYVYCPDCSARGPSITADNQWDAEEGAIVTHNRAYVNFLPRKNQ